VVSCRKPHLAGSTVIKTRHFSTADYPTTPAK
jgi:hypothetical protein